jgi:hypothetical protein
VRNQNKQGKTHEAMISCRAILAAARSIGDEPSIFSQMLRFRIRNLAVRSIEGALAGGEASEEMLRHVQADLQNEEAQPLLLIMVRAERALWHECLQSCENGDVPLEQLTRSGPGGGFDPVLLSKPFLPNSHAWIIRYFNHLVQDCNGATDKQMERIRSLAESITSAPDQVKSLFADQPDFYLRQADSVLGSQALLRCSITALACERFRLRNKRWPNNLLELVPSYLRDHPCDAYDGTPLHLQVLKDKIVIYSRRFQESDKIEVVANEDSGSKQADARFTLLIMQIRSGRFDGRLTR